MSGPTWPIPIPHTSTERSPQEDGDQKQLTAIGGSVMLSHNGGQYPYKDRPAGGAATRDPYIWDDET